MKQILKRVTAFSASLALSLSSLVFLASPNVYAAQITKVWDGGTDGNCAFSDDENWVDDTAPSLSGNTFILYFPASADVACRTVDMDQDGIEVDEINFTGAYSANPYTIDSLGSFTMVMVGSAIINNASTGVVADHTISVDLDFNGVGGSAPSIDNGSNVDATLTLSGLISIASGTILSVSSATVTDPSTELAAVNIDGAVSGAGSVTVSQGTTRFYSVNTYSGATNVSSGAVLNLSTVFATPGNNTGATTIASGGAMEISSDIANEPIEISGYGNSLRPDGTGALISNFSGLDLNDVTLLADAGICALDTMSINLVSPTLSSFTLYKMDDADCPGDETVDSLDSLDVYGAGETPPTGCTVAANGQVITIADGECYWVPTGVTAGAITVQSGGVLMGSGTVGNVDVEDGGRIAPGSSPGCLSTGDVTFAASSSYDVEIGGTTACSGYDQLQVTGSVTLNPGSGTGSGPSLNISLFGSFIPSVGDSFTIIDNDTNSDVVLNGTFNNLLEGESVTVDGVTYQISYVGGDGNDVVLTVTEVSDTGGTTDDPVPGTPETGFGAMLTNPATAMFSTTTIAAAILAIARKYSLLKG